MGKTFQFFKDPHTWFHWRRLYIYTPSNTVCLNTAQFASHVSHIGYYILYTGEFFFIFLRRPWNPYLKAHDSKKKKIRFGVKIRSVSLTYSD